MKVLGILMVFLSFTFAGFCISENYISKLKDIKRIDYLLKNIVLRIKNDSMTINEIFEEISKSSDEKTKKFISVINPESFDNLVADSENSLFCRNKSANIILKEAFSVLGRYSASEQEKEIELCRNRLRNLYEKSEENILSKAKLSKTSGILFGVFAAIIFL